ncbi:MAG TPA: hypothetical protein VEG30_06730 [Terriglobales bacterium]|nr:hypothetical protein [Terriglobales bacterium]
MEQDKDTQEKDTLEKENQTTAEKKAAVTLPGVVEKIIPPLSPKETEKAQITVEGADHLYREIRVDNILKDSQGKKVGLKQGAPVDVTIAADQAAIKKRPKSEESDEPSEPFSKKK